MGKRAGWIGGAVFLIVVILAGTWLLAASPRFESAAQTVQMAEEARSRNDLLELQVAKLRADFARLDEYRAELGEIQVQIPPDADLDAILAEVNALAAAAGAFVVNMTPGIPESVTFAQPAPVAPEPEPVVEEPAEGTDAEAADEPVDPVDPADPVAEEPSGPMVIDGFVAVPFQVTVLGTYDAVLAFLDSMQTGMDRLYLVTELTAVRQQTAEAASGKPPVADGDVELVVTGYAYVLANDLIRQAIGAEEVEEEPGSMPSGASNPFVPLTPSGSGAEAAG